MAKVTSRLQVTLPKDLAHEIGARPGDEIEFELSEGGIRMIPKGRRRRGDAEERLRIFDQATERQIERDAARVLRPAVERGWTREDLYARGRSR